MELQDSVAIVTGAGAGIGLAITKRFVEEGARVVAVEIADEGLARLKEVDGAIAVRGDVTQRADMERVVALAGEHGQLGIVVNNAGIVDRFVPVGELTDEVWQRVLAVNLTGPMLLCRAAIPVMLAAGRGVIINIASVAGIAGARGGAAYTASKHGVVGLTKNIAVTYGEDGIRCVAIAPGGVSTGISLGGEPSERGYAALNRTMPTMLRSGEPAEVANLVVFLASDEASFLNGVVITADAGWMAF